MRIVFLGSADFGIPTLEYLHRKHTLCGVVTTPPRRGGRGRKQVVSPVARFTGDLSGVPVFTPEELNSADFVAGLRALAADCFVVVAYRLLPREVFTLPSLGTINIHASLLPAYRGPAPIHRAIEAGERTTGVTVFRIDEGIDTGEILLQRSVDIGDEETTPEVYRRLSLLGTETLDTALAMLEDGTCIPQVQDHARACKAPKLKKSESVIDWHLSAGEIFNKIRAFKPFPGTATFFGGTRIGIEWGYPLERHSSDFCGTIVGVETGHFDVQTGKGTLRVYTVKPEGRKSMSVADYLRGTALTEGMRFDE